MWFDCIPPREGQRIRLLAKPGDPDALPAGMVGTVVSASETTPGWVVLVAWDNGRSLNLSLPSDQWEPV